MNVLIFPLVVRGGRPEMLQRLMEETGMAVMLDYDHRRQRAHWYLTPKTPEPMSAAEDKSQCK